VTNSPHALQDEIDLAKVPPKVRKAAEKAVSGVKWTSAYKHTDEGEVTFELEGTDAKGRTVTVDIGADGKVGEVATEIAAKEVPKPVTDAVKSFLPGFKASSVFEIREEGKVVGYESEGKRPQDKEEFTVFVSSDGKRIEIDLPE
jgi:hypothetical protein